MKHTIFLLLIFIASWAQANIKVAVASNFKSSLTEIAENYFQLTGETILISSASTGILYNQIKHGAPFDLFLSADSERASLIEEATQGVMGTRFTYAQGRLAFWVPALKEVTEKTLRNYKQRLAIANPKLAPYGLAAKQALQSMHLWEQFIYVQGANISQTYQFIDSGNIKAGFVAYSLLLQNNETAYYLLPKESYSPILQQGVLLSRGANNKAVIKFIDYLKSTPVQALIREKGYL